MAKGSYGDKESKSVNQNKGGIYGLEEILKLIIKSLVSGTKNEKK